MMCTSVSEDSPASDAHRYLPVSSDSVCWTTREEEMLREPRLSDEEAERLKKRED